MVDSVLFWKQCSGSLEIIGGVLFLLCIYFHLLGLENWKKIMYQFKFFLLIFFKISITQNNIVLVKFKKTIEATGLRKLPILWFSPVLTVFLCFNDAKGQAIEPDRSLAQFPVQQVRPAGPVFTTMVTRLQPQPTNGPCLVIDRRLWVTPRIFLRTRGKGIVVWPQQILPMSLRWAPNVLDKNTKRLAFLIMARKASDVWICCVCFACFLYDLPINPNSLYIGPRQLFVTPLKKFLLHPYETVLHAAAIITDNKDM